MSLRQLGFSALLATLVLGRERDRRGRGWGWGASCPGPSETGTWHELGCDEPLMPTIDGYTSFDCCCTRS